MIATYNCKVLSSSGVKVRPENSVSNSSIATLPVNKVFQISEKVADMDDPTNYLKVWGKIFGGTYDGKYVALDYPTATGLPQHLCSYELIAVVPHPIDTNPSIKEIAQTLDVIYNFESGSITKSYTLVG